MKVRLFTVLNILFFIGLACSCNDQDEIKSFEHRIYTSYEVEYNANEDKTIATAIFTFETPSGNPVKLIDNAEVKFNGQRMDFDKGNARYRLEMAGYSEKVTFAHHSIDGAEYINTINLGSISLPNNLNTTIDRSNDYEIEWEGNEISDNETVQVLLLPDNMEGVESVLDEVKATTIGFSAIQLGDLNTTSARLQIERSFANVLENVGEGGGIVRAKYVGKPMDVTLR